MTTRAAVTDTFGGRHTMSQSAAVLFLSCCLVVALSVPAPAPAPLSTYQRPLNSDCVSSNLSATSTSGSVNYFPRTYQIQSDSVLAAADTVTVTVAQDFSVQYFDSYKVVTNTLVNETYVLYQCGTPAPSTNSLPPGSKLFSVPLDSIAVLETVPVGFLVELGVMDRVQSVSSLTVSGCGQNLLACGKAAVDELTLDSSVLQSQVEPYTDGVIVSSAYANFLTTFAFSASMDPGPLNRAEWIKFLGLFFNLDAIATEVFDSINSSYYETKARVVPSQEPPLMAFVDYYDYSDETAYEVSMAAYKLTFTEDAGAATPNATELLDTPGVIYAPYDLTNSTFWFTWNYSGGGFETQAEAAAAFHSFLERVDIVVDETFVLNPTTYNLTTFLTNLNLSSSDNYAFLTNKAVLREDGLVSPAPAYGLAWFESAIARPDTVLQDFAAAVKPTQFPGYTATYIRNIARGENVTITTSQDCSQLSSCSQAPNPICPFVSTCTNGAVVQQENVNSTCSYVPCSA